MENSINILFDKRILIVTGHYGSGKTEFSVSLARNLHNLIPYSRLAICDLDIVNPYFRSREQADALSDIGVSVYGGIYGTGSTAEIPELSASIRAPLEDKECFSILDVGGNAAGARVLAQFKKYLTPDARKLVCVINASRMETREVIGAIEHLRTIEDETGIPVDGIVNNTHMLMETTESDIMRGHELCCEVSAKTGIPLLVTTYPDKLIGGDKLYEIAEPKMAVGMYMRQSWLDK